ncbi:MAG: thioredoxin-disulfide reductase [Candidatus Heimdallarchaeota archaeon]
MQLYLHRPSPSEEVDPNQEIIIIGSGPAGLTAAIYAARAQLNPLVVAGVESGGQLMTTTEVENYPGFPEQIQGPDLIMSMRQQAQRLGTTFVEEDVVDVNLDQYPFFIITGQHQLTAKAVIIATGASPKRLGLKNEHELSGRGISYCATCDAPFFKDVNAAVIGAGDSAFEEALFLAKYATSVRMIYRGPKENMRANRSLQKRAYDEEKIDFIYNTKVIEILGNQKLAGIKVYNNETQTESELALGGLLIAIGHIPQTQLFKDKLEFFNGYIVQKKHTMTSIPGVFAAGDVVDFRYRQAITAAGQGCQAAIDAERWLQDPDEF